MPHNQDRHWFMELSDFLRMIGILIGQVLCLGYIIDGRPFGRMGWFLLSISLAGWPEKRGRHA